MFVYNITKSLFSQTGKLLKTACKFGKLAEERKGSKDRKNNYLDSHITAEYRRPDEIKERIELKKKECGKYKLFSNNCEHLANYVRYNISCSVQVSGRLNSCNINVIIIFL